MGQVEPSTGHRPELGRRRFVLSTVLVCSVFWAADSVIDSLLFGEGPLLASVLSPEPVELWMRALLISMIVGSSFYIRTLLLREAEARATAEAADRAKSRFLANMSHEIRTPMTAILGYADELVADDDFPEMAPRRTAIAAIRRNGQHLLRIINDLLDLATIEEKQLRLELVSCSVRAMVAEVVSMIRVQAEAKELQISIEYPSNIPEKIQTDPTRLRQILVNLIGNAIKFTDRGTVRIVTRLIEEPTGSTIQFEVIDSGVGMTPAQSGQVFERFTQVDDSATRAYGGNGLGLTISRLLVEALDGTISVESQEGEGSTFRVSLPVARSDDSRLVETPAATMRLESSLRERCATAGSLDCRVLLVEDGPDNQALILSILERAGAEVTVADNGRMALERVSEASEMEQPFDAILMDMQMPVLDGYAATRALRRSGCTLPIIALTAHAMPNERDKCLSVGCDDFITKPIDRAALIETVAAHSRKA